MVDRSKLASPTPKKHQLCYETTDINRLKRYDLNQKPPLSRGQTDVSAGHPGSHSLQLTKQVGAAHDEGFSVENREETRTSAAENVRYIEQNREKIVDRKVLLLLQQSGAPTQGRNRKFPWALLITIS